MFHLSPIRVFIFIFLRCFSYLRLFWCALALSASLVLGGKKQCRLVGVLSHCKVNTERLFVIFVLTLP